MTFTKKQNDDLCVAAGVTPLHWEVVPVSSGTRSPHQFVSKSVADAYVRQHSLVFKHSYPVYPDLLTAEGFLILWRALMSLGCEVTITTGSDGSISAYVRNRRFGYEVKNIFDLKSVEEALFFAASVVLAVEVPGV